MSVVGLGLAGVTDVVVMEAARVQDRVLVSADTDFGEPLDAGAIVVVLSDRIRVRRLPLGVDMGR